MKTSSRSKLVEKSEQLKEGTPLIIEFTLFSSEKIPGWEIENQLLSCPKGFSTHFPGWLSNKETFHWTAPRPATSSELPFVSGGSLRASQAYRIPAGAPSFLCQPSSNLKTNQSSLHYDNSLELPTSWVTQAGRICVISPHPCLYLLIARSP